MKTIQFTPKACQGEGAKFKGQITLRLPGTVERFNYRLECGVGVNEAGEIEVKGDRLRAFVRMIELASKHYEKVEIEKADGSSKYECYADLDCDPECEEIIGEVASAVMNGFQPSKN